jgi:hypothetical protein
MSRFVRAAVAPKLLRVPDGRHSHPQRIRSTRNVTMSVASGAISGPVDWPGAVPCSASPLTLLVAHWKTRKVEVPRTTAEAHKVFWTHPTPIAAAAALVAIALYRLSSAFSVLDVPGASRSGVSAPSCLPIAYKCAMCGWTSTWSRHHQMIARNLLRDSSTFI